LYFIIWLDPEKYSSKKNYRSFFQKRVVLTGVAPKYPWAFRGQTMNQKTKFNGSLESYDPYLLAQKVSKYPHAFAILNNMPKTRKAIFSPLKSFRG
jgi:hypothetical protein